MRTDRPFSIGKGLTTEKVPIASDRLGQAKRSGLRYIRTVRIFGQRAREAVAFYQFGFKKQAMAEAFPLRGKSVLIFTGDIYEDLELWYPKLRLEEAGAKVVLAGPKANEVYTGKNGYPCTSDASIDDMDEANFDGLVVPGGFMPDKLRRDKKVLELVRAFDVSGKPIAAICHGGWIPISAGVYKGVRVTGSPGIKDDLVNAGAIYEDKSAVVDRNHVTSRKPDDLPDFCRELIRLLSA